MVRNRDFEFAFWHAAIAGLLKPKVPYTPYLPTFRKEPTRRLDHVSAWAGIETILADLIERFHIDTTRCLEFGVEHGFSTVALSSFFNSVTGVDIFTGDKHTANFNDIYNDTCERLAPYPNIRLVRADYRDYIRQDNTQYGIVHVDIVHTYADTYACGLWAVGHSQCALFHDTMSFPEVKQAVTDLARVSGKKLYNYAESNGLGILV